MSGAGTVLVKNIDPSDEPGSYSGDSDASHLTALGERLFFSAHDDAHGRELWRSDGSGTGTVLVKNIDPTDGGEYPGGYPASLATVGDRLYFEADDDSHGRELWMSDGSRLGTALLKDIDPGGRGSHSLPASLTAVGERLFFSATDGVHGRELWRSNGTPAGTVMVKDIDGCGSGGSLGYRVHRAVMGGRLYFAARGTAGQELWKSDGSRAGTVLVKDINTGATG